MYIFASSVVMIAVVLCFVCVIVAATNISFLILSFLYSYTFNIGPRFFCTKNNFRATIEVENIAKKGYEDLVSIDHSHFVKSFKGICF